MAYVQYFVPDTHGRSSIDIQEELKNSKVDSSSSDERTLLIPKE